MATATDRRIIQVDVTTDPKARKSIREVNAHLRSLEGSAKRTQREVTRMSKSFNLLSIAAKAYIAIRVARAVTDTSDAMILLGARINIVTEETVGVNKAFDDLFEISTLTRQSIQATGTLYARLGFATKALNLEHQDLLEIVQGVNNTLLLSGASAQESASSIIQLSQAFSKGSLDGDEFRSVSEGNVILFGLMQEVLGKTARELRQFSRDGKLTGDLLAQVLTSEQVKALQGRVDEIPFTFGQAFTLIGNELAELARDFEDEFTAITEAIVEGIRGFGVLKQFFDALDAGLLPESSVFDIFSLDDIESELKKLEDASGTFGVKAIAHMTELNNKIAELNDPLNETKVLLDNALEALDKPLFTDPDGFFGVFGRVQMAGRKRDVDGLTKRYNEQRIEVVKLQAELRSLLGPKTKTPTVLDTTDGRIDDKLAKEFESIRLSTRTASEVLAEYLDQLDEYVGKGLDVEVANNAATNAQIKYSESLKETDKVTKEVEKSSNALGVALGQSLERATSSVADTLVDFAMGMETSFADMVESIIADVARLIVQLTLLNSIKAGLGTSPAGLFLFPPTGSAKGNVFDQGSITPFATGGVINSPTYFPMSDGVGLLGEAGPEAILPLTRGSDGKLGVSGAGGPEQVTVVIENNGSDSTVTSSTATTDINGTVVNIILDDINRGGPLRDSFKSLR